jgi:hypothetical protein
MPKSIIEAGLSAEGRIQHRASLVRRLVRRSASEVGSFSEGGSIQHRDSFPNQKIFSLKIVAIYYNLLIATEICMLDIKMIEGLWDTGCSAKVQYVGRSKRIVRNRR